MPRINATVEARLLLNERVLFVLIRRLIDEVREAVHLPPLEPNALLALLREIVRTEMQKEQAGSSPQGETTCS